MADATTDPTAQDTDTVYDQEQGGPVSHQGPGPTLDTDARAAGDDGEPARGSGEADDDQAPIDADDPELSGADLDEDQAEGRGPSIEPGA